MPVGMTSTNNTPIHTATDGEDYQQFIVNPVTVPTTEGTLSWNAQDHTLNIQPDIAASLLQVGQESWVRVVNKTGVQINDNQAVYISGAQGNRPKAALAKADAEATSYTIGVATDNIADNAEGFVTVFGLVRGYNTSSFTAGDKLYLSDTTAGALTNVRPVAPSHGVFVAIALNSTNNGSIFVNPDIGSELDELHDVKIASVAAYELLVRNSANTYWENSTKVRLNDSTTTLYSDSNGGTANDLTLSCGTQKTLSLAYPVWNDAFVDALSLIGGATDPPVFAVFMNGVYGYRFDNAAVMSAHGTIELPHDYKEGTDVDLHVHWSPTTTNTGNCQWSIEYTIANINATFPATTTVSAVQAGAGIVARHQLLDVATISGTGRKISDVICFRVFRDGNAVPDTFTGNAFLHRVAVHYQCDTLGSRQETIK